MKYIFALTLLIQVNLFSDPKLNENVLKYIFYDKIDKLIQLKAKKFPYLKWKYPYNGYSLLHFAVIYQSPLSINFLINNGVSIKDTTNHGDTALHIAAFNNYQVACKLLYSASSLAVVNMDGKTPLQIAKNRNSNECLRYFQWHR